MSGSKRASSSRWSWLSITACLALTWEIHEFVFRQVLERVRADSGRREPGAYARGEVVWLAYFGLIALICTWSSVANEGLTYGEAVYADSIRWIVSAQFGVSAEMGETGVICLEILRIGLGVGFVNWVGLSDQVEVIWFFFVRISLEMSSLVVGLLIHDLLNMRNFYFVSFKFFELKFTFYCILEKIHQNLEIYRIFQIYILPRNRSFMSINI